MNWPSISTDTVKLLPVLERIAAALERIAPEEAAAEELKPEDAVQYVDEEAMAKQEYIEQLGADARRLQEYAAEHPEEFSESADV